MTAAALLLGAAAGCDDNPVAEGVAEVARLDFDRTFASVAPDDSITLVVTPEDRYQDPVEADVTFTACDEKVTLGEVRRDEADLTEQHLVVVRGTDNLGFTCIRATSGGVTEEARILVVPDFPVTDVQAAAAGNVVTVTRAVGQPVFDSNTGVAISDGFDERTAFIVSKTEDEMQFVVPFSMGAGERTIIVNNAGPGDDTITGDFTITSDADPLESDFGAEVTVDVPFDVFAQVTDEDVSDVFTFVAPETGTVDVLLDWDEGSSDLDLYLLDSAEETLNFGWYDHPENFTEDVTAGETYYVYIDNFSAEGATTYRLRVVYTD